MSGISLGTTGNTNGVAIIAEALLAALFLQSSGKSFLALITTAAERTSAAVISF
jgi:hypothetical protein